MKATVYSHNTIIGTSELSVTDNAMGVVSGEFIPTEAYFNKIQKHVWNFWSEKKTNWKEWYSLKLNIQLENGYFLYAQGGVSIDDLEELIDEPLNVEIVGLDRHVLDNYFHSIPAKTFTEKPWNPISIQEKLSLEKELNIELGISKNSFFSFLKPPVKHPLSEYTISAICRDQRNDDVLFRTEKIDSQNQFAVVHLTWKGEKEIEGYPQTTFFKTFDDFKTQRMKSDQEGWD